MEAFGAYIIDTDKLAREAVAPGSDALREIARSWPSVVRMGGLNRPALAEIVFHDPTARERLNAIVHPHVRRLADAAEAYAKAGQIVVQVVPLLFERAMTLDATRRSSSSRPKRNASRALRAATTSAKSRFARAWLRKSTPRPRGRVRPTSLKTTEILQS